MKSETFGDDVPKYLLFSASGQNRFTRVSEKNFGEGYTKETIREGIEKRVKEHLLFIQEQAENRFDLLVE